MHRKISQILIFIGFLLSLNQLTLAQPKLQLPIRNQNALSGTQLVEELRFLDREHREQRIFEEVTLGNIPTILRTLVPIEVKKDSVKLVFYAISDYLSVGSDSNYFRIPLTPITAQKLASRLGLLLPTSLLVDYIFEHAEIRLNPQPIPPSDSMTTITVFFQHNKMIKQQLDSLGLAKQSGKVLAGHKKDVIVSNRVYNGLKKNVPKPVVIYGWHKPDGEPIQPVYNGHAETYADYSHGIRFIWPVVLLNGKEYVLTELLRNNELHRYVSKEGIIIESSYSVE